MYTNLTGTDIYKITTVNIRYNTKFPVEQNRIME